MKHGVGLVPEHAKCGDLEKVSAEPVSQTAISKQSNTQLIGQDGKTPCKPFVKKSGHPLQFSC